jgi:hypothetical protein
MVEGPEEVKLEAVFLGVKHLKAGLLLMSR